MLFCSGSQDSGAAEVHHAVGVATTATDLEVVAGRGRGEISARHNVERAGRGIVADDEPSHDGGAGNRGGEAALNNMNIAVSWKGTSPSDQLAPLLKSPLLISCTSAAQPIELATAMANSRPMLVRRILFITHTPSCLMETAQCSDKPHEEPDTSSAQSAAEKIHLASCYRTRQ